jgi:cytochrome c-type biogenesis protein CcmH
MSVAITVVSVLVVVIGLSRGQDEEPDRARALAGRLRCPVCSSESVADSPSRTAREMVGTIEEQVSQGRSDDEILGFFRHRYGDWILLDPPKGGRTWVVWALPVLALGAGAVVVVTRVQRRPMALPAAELATVEAQLARLRQAEGPG